MMQREALQAMDFERYGHKPLYCQLAERIKRDIESGVIGENAKLPPEETLAETLNVCRPTIRSALKKLEAEGYLFRVRGKGTFAVPRKRRMRRIVVVEEMDPLRNRNKNQHSMIAGISARGQDDGLNIQFIVKDRLLEAIPSLRNNEIYQSGIVFLHNYEFDNALLEALDKAGLPWLCAGSEHPANSSFVDIDNETAMMKIIDHLVELNHRSFAVISITAKQTFHFKQRKEACLGRLRERGIPFDESGIFHVSYNLNQIAAAETVELCKRIYAGGKGPTALVCVDDFLAIHAMKYLQDAGIAVPGQVSVTGFGNNQGYERVFSPRLTTINQDYFELGFESASALLDMMDNCRKIQIKMQPELIVGESTGMAKR